MEEALKKKLVLLAFVPAVIASTLLAGTLWLTLMSSTFVAWVMAERLEEILPLAAVLVAVVFIFGELAAILRVCRIAKEGTKILLKATETGRIYEKDIPAPLKEDIEFNVLARRIEQLSRGGKEAPEVSKKLASFEGDVRKITGALEEVSTGNSYVPVSEGEGPLTGVISLLNRVLPELSELRRSATGTIGSIEAELRETTETTRELAETAERAFLESTEALVAAREAGRLASETEQKLRAVMATEMPTIGLQSQKVEIRNAVTRLIESAAKGIEELTRGLMRANSLSRSSERIANRASVLALNIAMESARASLPGMNVLAGEINKLADFARASSDESAALVREIEAQIDTVVRGIHLAQEDVRQKTRLLGVGVPGEEGGERGSGADLPRFTARLCDSVGRLVSRVQELSKLTERTSRDAERLSRKAVVAYEQARTAVENEECKSPSAEVGFPEIHMLSDEDLLTEDPAPDEQEGE